MITGNKSYFLAIGAFTVKIKVFKVPTESNSAFFIAEKLLIAHLNGARIGFTTVDHIWRSKGRSKFNNPVMALFTLSELFNFWLTYRSRPKIDLYKEYANRQ